MWLQRSLSIIEVIWLLEEISRNRVCGSDRFLVSSDSDSVVTMVKNWTAENYIFPHDQALIAWVAEKVEGVPSKYSDEGSLS
ncbi:hypothetical protein A2U01_0066684, partial [Trifolium medium]|nr:hypothetical protein [Trifolium medium]